MKYRVWCKNKKEYQKDQCFLTPDGRLFQEGPYGSMQPLSLETHIIERGTDLKDKNGKYVYENDIVNAKAYGWRRKDYKNVTVEYDSGIGFHPFNDTSSFIDEDYICSTDDEDIEIVGNAHDKDGES